MSPENITKAIDDAIRRHELRVALWSGLMGALLLTGTWHGLSTVAAPDEQPQPPKITKLPRNGPKPGQSVAAWLYGKDKRCQAERDGAQWKRSPH